MKTSDFYGKGAPFHCLLRDFSQRNRKEMIISRQGLFFDICLLYTSLRFAPGSGAERFSTRTRKTFNISTEFYTEYSGFSTAFVENPVESVEKGVK